MSSQRHVIVWRRSKNLPVSTKETVKVIFDSSFLFVPSQFHLDVFEELTNLLNQCFDPILLSPTQKELQKLAEAGSPKTRKQASLALKLAEKCRLVYIEKGSKETHDDVIVRVAAEWKCPAATNDRELRKRLRNLGVPVIFLRQRHRLELEGAV
jgi:rRNA-processing protein FCF1